MNRWIKITNRCCREPVFWAALLTAGFGAWLYGHEADYSSAPPARHAAAPVPKQPDAAAAPVPHAERSRHGGGDGVAGRAPSPAPDATRARRLMREANALVARGDELLLEAGLPDEFLERASLNSKTIRRVLDDADRRSHQDARSR